MAKVIFEKTYLLDEIQLVVDQLMNLNLVVPGKTIIFSGQLGAGKTTLIKAWGKRLGISNINSPTFILQNIYKFYDHSQKEYTLEHWDLYRLNTVPEELLEDGRESIRFVEWGDKFPQLKKNAQIVLELIDQFYRKIMILSWE